MEIKCVDGESATFEIWELQPVKRERDASVLPRFDPCKMLDLFTVELLKDPRPMADLALRTDIFASLEGVIQCDVKDAHNSKVLQACTGPINFIKTTSAAFEFIDEKQTHTQNHQNLQTRKLRYEVCMSPSQTRFGTLVVRQVRIVILCETKPNYLYNRLLNDALLPALEGHGFDCLFIDSEVALQLDGASVAAFVNAARAKSISIMATAKDLIRVDKEIRKRFGNELDVVNVGDGKRSFRHFFPESLPPAITKHANLVIDKVENWTMDEHLPMIIPSHFVVRSNSGIACRTILLYRAQLACQTYQVQKDRHKVSTPPTPPTMAASASSASLVSSTCATSNEFMSRMMRLLSSVMLDSSTLLGIAAGGATVLADVPVDLVQTAIDQGTGAVSIQRMTNTTTTQSTIAVIRTTAAATINLMWQRWKSIAKRDFVTGIPASAAASGSVLATATQTTAASS